MHSMEEDAKSLVVVKNMKKGEQVTIDASSVSDQVRQILLDQVV
jgi:histidyl-tRNA synthetase